MVMRAGGQVRLSVAFIKLRHRKFDALAECLGSWLPLRTRKLICACVNVFPVALTHDAFHFTALIISVAKPCISEQPFSDGLLVHDVHESSRFVIPQRDWGICLIGASALADTQ